jgi:trehalose synthase
MLGIMDEQGVDPAALIHALQNHDELTLELVHFWTLHKDDTFTLGGRTLTGSALREEIRAEMYQRLADDVGYNLRFVTNGVASTTASVIAAALRIPDLEQLTPEQAAMIQRCHLLLCMYNAFQPGVFALSGWDLVGALTLPAGQVEALLADGDTRWIHRGAYDLMGIDPVATASAAGMPRARALYGSLPEQLGRADSFVRQLQRLLAVRQRYGIYAGRRLAVAETVQPALLVMVHDLPDGRGIQVTALNFGPTPVAETVMIDAVTIEPGGAARRVVDMLTEQPVRPLSGTGGLDVVLDAYEGKSYLIAR